MLPTLVGFGHPLLLYPRRKISIIYAVVQGLQSKLLSWLLLYHATAIKLSAAYNLNVQLAKLHSYAQHCIAVDPCAYVGL